MSFPGKLALFVLAVSLPTAVATAQPLGTFRWQLQPYCNVMSVTVTQQGGIYTLDGTDDLCGGAQAASAAGIAFLNPSGPVGFGLTSVLPNGTPIHLEATINIASLNGTWRDSAGNSGSLIFTPGLGVGGAPRPVPSGGIAAGSVTAVQIAPGAVGPTQLSPNSVSGSNIVDGSITSADIHDGPRSAFAEGDLNSRTVPGTDTVIRSVTINAPAAGKVIVNASAFFEFPSAATLDNARCEISTTTTIDNPHALYAREYSVDAVHYVPFASTRGFDVVAGNTTFNLLCSTVSGSVNLWRSFMTAIYTRQ
jgi:hypothetical protein